MSRILLALLIATPAAIAAPVPKIALTAEQEAEFDRLWDATGSGPAAAVHLYCRLIHQPDAAVAYLIRHLPPAAMTEAEAAELIEALSSDDAKIWKPAYRALCNRDVRLALSPVDVWNDNASAAFRQRFGAILMGYYGGPDRVPAADEVTFTLAKVNSLTASRWHLIWRRPWESSGTSVVIHPDYAVSERSRANYYRAKRSVVAAAALEHIGTPAARAHLKALANGHTSSAFTVEAKASVERFVRPRNPLGERPTDLWKWELQKFTALTTVDRFLAGPKETVALCKEKFKPLVLSKKDGANLLARLFGDDAKEWQGAMAEMRYFDLRLAMSVEDAWVEAKTATHRGRLVSALWLRSDASDDFTRVDDESRLFDFTLHPPNPDFNGWHATWRVRDGLSDEDAQQAKANRRFGGSARVDNVLADETSKLGETRWPREESAIYILDAIGSDDAVAIIKDMATGHPDAGPTKAARAVLKRRGNK